MSKEETTQEVDATEEEVVEEEEEETSEPIEKEKEEETSKKEEIDYDAITKEEEKRADPEKAKEAFKKREEKRVKEEVEDEDKPLTRAEIDKMLKDNRQTVRKEFEQDRAMEIAKANTSSDAEAKAVIAFWKNRIVPTGDLEEDVLFALGGLQRKTLISKNGELKRALKSKDNVSKDSASTHRDAPEGSKPKLSQADAQGLKSAGFVWDGKKRLYKKALPKGKFLWKEPNGKTWMA